MKKYTAIYFDKTTKIIKNKLPNSITTLQFFQRKDDVLLAGMNEALEFLSQNTNLKKYSIKYMQEASIINAGEVVLELEGNYSEFGLWEGIIDGILARATSLATNAYRVSKLTNKPIIFMGDRADHYINQERDGYAVALGGVKTQVTFAQVSKHDGMAVGTMPHALLQAFEGDIVKATHAYHETFPDEQLTVLVDFNNDVVGDALKALKEFGKLLIGVRVDTPKNVSDKMFINNEEFGVTPNLVKGLRKELDKNGGQHVKIIISSSVNAETIKEFEKLNTPVDVYGIGSALLDVNNTFTADAVKINGKKLAKVSRKYSKNDKLVEYK